MDYNEHDCGVITAYNQKYTPHENEQRNKQLQAKIEVAKYSLLVLFQDEMRRFFVVDSNDIGELHRDLKTWSEQYEQEEIRFARKGTFIAGDSFSEDEVNEVEIGKEKIANYYRVANIFGKWAMKNIANSDWRLVQV
jgi:hypothetical protein